MATLNVPAPFPGTPEEAAKNRETHIFDWDWMRCVNCDSRPTAIADWPCGTTVPRLVREVA